MTKGKDGFDTPFKSGNLGGNSGSGGKAPKDGKKAPKFGGKKAY